ncbi:hypothetical protein ACWOFR_17715 [Carnobacterium gallinarum]|uniref:hypothetical protein n=1 Tax=Carnobacterium gallinarum TaxID=2749 RepID=UPI000557F652|nr:hypothetical protein [Carnobacterium gallinarum]
MNINLLPQKFVKNKATTIIFFSTIIISITIALLFVGLYFFLTIRLNQVMVDEQQKNLERIGLEKKVSELENAQSKDIQEFLIDLKNDKYLISPVMASFDKTAKELDLKLLNYQIGLSDIENQTEQVEKSSNDEELLPAITLRLQGDLFTNMPKLKKELEKNDWVYDVMPVSVSNDSDNTESEFIIRIKKNLVDETTVEEGAK